VLHPLFSSLFLVILIWCRLTYGSCWCSSWKSQEPGAQCVAFSVSGDVEEGLGWFDTRLEVLCV
jgi:hypothetical protein